MWIVRLALHRPYAFVVGSTLVPTMSDKREVVRDTAAAVIRLTTVAEYRKKVAKQ